MSVILDVISLITSVRIFVDFHSINDSVYSGLGRVQDSIWAESIPGYVQTDRYYYDPDEGRELLASVGMVPSDIKFSFAYTTHPWETIGEVVVEWEKAGVQIDLTVIRPEDSFLPKLDNIGLMQVGSGYTGILTAAFWMRMLMGVNTPYKVSWQELYGPDLYRQIQDEYDAMIAAATWYDMLEHAAAMTKITQDIFGAVACVQAPNFIALSKDFKNGVYFSEDHDIQLYYLYR